MPAIATFAAASARGFGARSLILQEAVTPIVHNTNRGGWGAWTMRQIIGTSALIRSGTGVRVTLEAAGTGSLVVLAAYIGEQSGSGQAFVTTPVQILFGGSGAPTITAGTTLESDTLDFRISGSSGLIVAVAFNSANIRGKSGATAGYESWYKSGNDAATVAASGYTNWSANDAINNFQALKVLS